MRYLPLIECKLRLRSFVPRSGERLLYCDHVEHDLEAIVAKPSSIHPYRITRLS